jgi:multidrug efflux pump subunit AcrA (membrane-fusion protein)
MTVKGLLGGLASLPVWAALAFGQNVPTAARIETIPLELTMPERYRVTEVLEPVRRVIIVAPVDGMIRAMDVRVGATIRESQEVAQLDRTAASARLKMARAELKEKQALVKSTQDSSVAGKAQLEAAEAKVELAQLELDLCTLRAPFAGRVTALPVCTGQYVLKGTTIAELADITSLKTLQPVDRRSVTAGAPLSVQIEGKDVAGKVSAIVPLPEGFATLRELATPLAAALVVVANTKGDLEPGLRVQTSSIPNAPLASIPKRACKPDEERGSSAMTVQVIRDEHVTNVPVRVLGNTSPERVQITGALRASDALVVSSSVPLLPGTLVRFGAGSDDGASGGAEAGITSPSRPRGRPVGAGAAAPRGSVPRERPEPRQAGAGSSPF